MLSIEIIYLSLALLGIIIAVWIIGTEHLFHVASPAAWFLLAITVVYFLRPLIFFLKNDWRQWDMMALPPFGEIGLQYGLVVFLFVIAFALGYGRSARMSFYIRSGKENIPYSARKVIYGCLLVLTIFGYLMALKYRPTPWEGAGVTMGIQKGYTVYRQTTGYFVHAVNLVPACAMVYYAISRNLRLSALLICPYILLQFYNGWGRSHFLLPTIGFLGLAGLLYQTGRANKKDVAAIFLALLLMLPILAVLGENRDYFKQELETKERTYQLNKAQKRWTASTGADLVGFSNSAFYIVNSGKSFPHGYCLRYVYVFFIQPIPRMLWKDKPVPSDFDSATFGHRGMTAGILGGPYHELGFFGVILLFIHGWIVKRAMVWFANPARPSLLAGYGFLLAYVVWSPFGWVPMLPFYLLPILTTYLIERNYILQEDHPRRISLLPGKPKFSKFRLTYPKYRMPTKTGRDEK